MCIEYTEISFYYLSAYVTNHIPNVSHIHKMNKAIIKSVSKSNSHTFSKFNCDKIILLKGLGVKGDAHMGEKVKHRSRVSKDPNQPNLRQIHLIHSELFDELKEKRFIFKMVKLEKI